MKKSYKLLLFLITIVIVIGSLNMVSASELSSEDISHDSTISSILGDNNYINNNSLISNIIHVSNDGNDDEGDGSENSPYKTLSQAINKSSDGSVIYLADGNYTGEKNRNLIISKNLTIKSLNGISFINAEKEGRIFYLLNNVSLNLDGLYLCGNASNYNNCGGAIYSEGDLNLNNCIFNDCYAGDGGAVYSLGSLIVNTCEFNTGYATNGGAIYSKKSLIVSNSTFNDNRALASGGAIYNLADNLLINNSKFFRNHAMCSSDEVSGGAVSNYGNNFNLLNSLFDGNYAREISKRKNGAIYGGAVSNYGSGFYVFSCELINNYAEIRTDASASEACLNSTFGGAIYTVAGAKIVNNKFENDSGHCRYSTNQISIYGNRCYGGALYCGYGNSTGEGLYLLNNTFINCPSSNGAVFNSVNNAIYENNTFKDSVAMFRGSAVHETGENVLFIGNSFLNANSTANYAGSAVWVSSFNVTFDNNTFKGNHDNKGSNENSGAIYIDNYRIEDGVGLTNKTSNVVIKNNKFDDNDMGVFLYAVNNAVVSNNSFTNQKYQSISTYVGSNVNILDNYFENNHGYFGNIWFNSANSTISNNIFKNNSGNHGGAIAILCRDTNITGNYFANNSATSGGGDIYALYGEPNYIVGNTFINGSSPDGSSLWIQYGQAHVNDNSFYIYSDSKQIINQSLNNRYYNNTIYDYSPVNPDGTVSDVNLNDYINHHTKTENDFTIIRNATERDNVDLNEDSNNSSNNTNPNPNPIPSPIEEIINNITQELNNNSGSGSGSGAGSSNGNSSSLNSGDINSSGENSQSSVSNSTSSVGVTEDGKTYEVNKEDSSSSSPSDAAESASGKNFYDISKHKINVSEKSVNEYLILAIVLVILLVYGGYRGKKEM